MAAFFRYSEGDTSQTLGSLDPNGAVLGIPGTGDPDAPFSAGIAVPSAGGLNIVEDIFASYDYEYYQGGVTVSLPYAIGPRSILAPIFGVSYLDIDQTTKFSGTVPGFGFAFGYDTPVSMSTWQMLGGLRYECKFSEWVGFFAEPSAQINFIDVSGSDRFTLDGTVATAQKVGLDKDETHAGLIVKIGIEIEPPDQPFDIYLGGRFDYQPDSVTIFRSGERDEQSRANIHYSETYTIEGSFNWNF
jgi:hypothetical protein